MTINLSQFLIKLNFHSFLKRGLMSIKIKNEVVVIGGGPAGYSAAFRCADLGLKTILVERYNKLGGVCLNVGCIPSKTLLNISQYINKCKDFTKLGFFLENPKINIDEINNWKKNIINKLTMGLTHLAKKRNVTIVCGLAKFINPNTLTVTHNKQIQKITFDNAIIAAGSSPMEIPFICQKDPRIWNSTDALSLKNIPKHILIIGAGIIGLEIGTIYHSLGSRIDIVEIKDQIISQADKDMVNILTKQIEKKFKLMLNTKVTNIDLNSNGIYVSMEGNRKFTHLYDAVLIAIGRTPNGHLLDAHLAEVNVDSKGFVCVDKQMRTSNKHIYAVGDIVGQPMLAHKGIYEGRLAAEVLAGKNYFFDSKVIPCITYTEPELSWTGVTEKEAIKMGINYDITMFPWSALGRAIACDSAQGATKIIFNKDNHRIIGGAIVGNNSSEMLGEICLAIEMGCDIEDIALTIHAHPTLHESIKIAAEMVEGSATDLINQIIPKIDF